MKNILEDLEILILQNEDEFDRGSGKFILRNFIKEKQAKQLTLTGVSQQRELLIAFNTMREFDIKHDDIEKSVDYFLKNKESYL